MEIDTGDEVLHRPSGERWVVAYVSGDRLSWLGWPHGMAAVADCELVKKCSPDERMRWLTQMSEVRDDPRGRYARQRLADHPAEGAK